jgi:hypothetical protein
MAADGVSSLDIVVDQTNQPPDLLVDA